MQILRKIGLSDRMAKNFFAILLVACSCQVIYALPYFRYDFYDVYLATYQLTDAQMGYLGSAFGCVATSPICLEES